MNPTYIIAALAALAFLMFRREPDPLGPPSPTAPPVPPPAPAPTDLEGTIVAALEAICRADNSPAIATLVEKVFRLETANFTSGGFRATNMCGQKALTRAFPWGWPARGTTAADYGPPVTMVDNGEGLAARWVNYRQLAVGMGYLAQYIRDYNGNAARWNSTDPAAQAVYNGKLQNIAAPLAAQAWARVKG